MKLLCPPDAFLEGIIRLCMCLCVVLSTANLAHSRTHPPFILCALLWAFAQRLLMVEVIHNFWKPVLLTSLFSAAVDSWLLLSGWSSTPSVCPQRHKVDICTLLTENHDVYPLKANFRVHLSSFRCSPVSWDVVCPQQSLTSSCFASFSPICPVPFPYTKLNWHESYSDSLLPWSCQTRQVRWSKDTVGCNCLKACCSVHSTHFILPS